MATPERDRPQQDLSGVPRGVEVLIKKASVDPEFRALLLKQRANAAKEIGLELSAAESTMIDTVPAAQLEAIIARTVVPKESRAAFLGRAASVMLAAAGAGTQAGCKGRTDAEEKALKVKARREMEEADRAVEKLRISQGVRPQKPKDTRQGARVAPPNTPARQPGTEKEPDSEDAQTTKPLIREFGTLGIQPDRPGDVEFL